MEASSNSRRRFLLNATKAFGLLASANFGVYAVGTAFKNLDGSLTAGAKTWTLEYQTGAGILGCSVVKVCNTTAGSCPTLGATKIVWKCGCEGNGPGNEFSNGVYSCQ